MIQLPGEQMIVALINYASLVRQTMDVELQKRLDKVIITGLEDMQNVWRKILQDGELINKVKINEIKAGY